MKLRRLVLPIIAATAVSGLSACGDDGPLKEAESEGQYVTVGKLEYQVQISRQLNPSDVEDRDYLQGLAPVQEELKADETWFGIFIRVKNPSDETLETAEEIVLEDTVEEKYFPVETESIINYEPTTLTPGDIFPHSNEVASYGPTQGKLLLFKLTNATLDNRPLELKIESRGEEGEITIDV